jgi:hypothetical protein
MQSDTKQFFKKLIVTNVGFAMFGTPIALLFLQQYRETTLLNAIGVVFIFFTVFIVMYVGLDIIIKNWRNPNG